MFASASDSSDRSRCWRRRLRRRGPTVCHPAMMHCCARATWVQQNAGEQLATNRRARSQASLVTREQPSRPQ
eukprot:2110210-Prorocentrum_lima.AAC.1